MMNILILLFLTVQTVPAQSTRRNGPSITDPSIFFPHFFAQRPTERGEFETYAEYEERIARRPDTSRVFRFTLDAISAEFTKDYSYDIDNESLTVIGGKCNDYWYRDYKHGGGFQVVISTKVEEKEPYQASNAFGKTVLVRKIYNHEYVINFVNWGQVPDTVRNLGCGFRMSIPLPPKEAKKLSPHLSLLLGIKVLDYQRSNVECVSASKPKIDNPTDISVFSYLIEARFVSLSLYDVSSKKIVLQVEVPQ